jgi:hypothetical protein
LFIQTATGTSLLTDTQQVVRGLAAQLGGVFELVSIFKNFWQIAL